MRQSLLITMLFLLIGLINAQTTDTTSDSLRVEVGTGLTLATEDFIPFYLVHNRFGEVANEPNNFITGALHYENALSKKWQWMTGFSFRNERLSSYYLGVNYQDFYLRLGAFKETIGGINSELTVSNFGLSRNARPIPMVESGIENYKALPFWNGLIEIKGRMGIRWLENERYISGALMHNKDASIRFNLEKYIGIKISTGFYHFAQFGGIGPLNNRQPSSFKDFLTVFKGGGVPNPDGSLGGEANGLGNHLGMHEITLEKNIKGHELILNYQSPFEDNGSMQVISLQDFSLAFHWSLPKKTKGLKAIQVEYVQTKVQSGPGLPDAIPQYPDIASNFGFNFGGRDDLHNNWLFKSGYTYRDMVIGNPLFLTDEWTSLFLEPFPTYDVKIVSNRTKAWNFSANGELTKSIHYLARFTYSQNWGTYAGLYEGRFNWGGLAQDSNFDYVFKGGKTQSYSSISLNFIEPFRNYPFNIDLIIAADFGELYTNYGMELVVKYVLSKH